MKISINILLATSLLFLLSGCGDDELQKAQVSTPMSEDNVFKPQVDALNKAKGVEQTIQSSFDQTRQKIDAEQ